MRITIAYNRVLAPVAGRLGKRNVEVGREYKLANSLARLLKTMSGLLPISKKLSWRNCARVKKLK